MSALPKQPLGCCRELHWPWDAVLPSWQAVPVLGKFDHHRGFMRVRAKQEGGGGMG